LEVAVLARPTSVIGWGLLARASIVNWQATFFGQVQGAPPSTIESSLTTALLGGALHVNLRPDAIVSPIARLVLGLAMETASPSYPWSGDGGLFAPAAELGAGASLRVSPQLAVFMLAQASGSWRLGDHSNASDAPPSPPLAMWGLGVEAGVAFDVNDTSTSRTSPPH
jgi:hypothetical protein